MLPKHKYLLTYRYAEIIHDLTTEFCLSHLSYLGNLRGLPVRRTIEQMTQASRSGKQNVVEGVSEGRTSKSGEIKLLGVAKSSFEELIADLEDFLRQNGFKIWPKIDKRIAEFRTTTYRLTDLGNLSNLGNLREKPVLPSGPEAAANFLLTLCHQETFLLDRQIKKAEQIFIQKGGYRENLFKRRVDFKKKHD